jgi:peptidyl-prolyl cis-trans isomerase SurA
MAAIWGVLKEVTCSLNLNAPSSYLKPGSSAKLVYTPLGLHIIKLEETHERQAEPLETVKTALMDTLYRKKSEERFNRWAKELRSRSSI